jgi:hypothetical protein
MTTHSQDSNRRAAPRKSGQRYSPELLRRIRNEIPIDWLIAQLDWPHKRRDGRFVFLCPLCGETLSSTKWDTNLARCFHCATNFNPIDFTMHVRDCEFTQAVEFLRPFLKP